MIRKLKSNRNWWFSDYFSRFRLRISQTENFGFGWPTLRKPIETEPTHPYERILGFFIVMDLSSNKFERDIPEVMGNVKWIQLLNLFNNLFTGSIPLSLEKLTMLESLGISQSKLSGEIPPQLTQLTFLAFFNVSNNHLIGSIPHGK